jgi:CRP-like cAMP-binding protein
MLLNIGELSEGMGKIFIRKFMETAQYITCSRGQVIFRKGEATHHFYTLIQGELRITIGTNEQHVYTVNLPGELFGWSSLVAGRTYSATAICTNFSEILRFDSYLLNDLLNRFPASGFLFYKKLTQTLGNRLLESYRIIQRPEIAGRCQEGADYLE